VAVFSAVLSTRFSPFLVGFSSLPRIKPPSIFESASISPLPPLTFAPGQWHAVSRAMPTSGRGTSLPMNSQLVAISLHRIPRKEVCGVVILAQQGDESWVGKCSKCGGEFRMEPDPKFEARVRAMRN
jgi:hypothetical protein